MKSDIIPQLEAALNKAVVDLKTISAKKMFGCHAVWVGENVFALVWKTGRIGFKLPEETSYESLMSKDGAGPWKAGPKQMTHWVLVPESYHAKPAELRKWAAKAHELCATLQPKAKTKKPAAKAKSKVPAATKVTSAKTKAKKVK